MSEQALQSLFYKVPDQAGLIEITTTPESTTDAVLAELNKRVANIKEKNASTELLITQQQYDHLLLHFNVYPDRGLRKYRGCKLIVV